MSLESLKAEALGWWEMQEASGTTIADTSGNGRDGAASSAITTRTGPTAWLPTGIVFASKQVAFPAAAFVGGSGARTYALWVQCDYFGYDTSYNIACFGSLGAGGGVKLGVCPEDDAFSVFFQNHRVITPKSALSIGVWYHLTIRVPAGATTTDDAEVLINGVQQTLSNEAGSAQTLNTLLETSQWLGNDPVGSRYFGGALAGFCTFDRALSDAEVLTLVTGAGSGGDGGEGGGGGESAGLRRRVLGLGGNLGLRR